ncbi:hypothetical protein F4778DRAFT_720164 [Xylariomycetidae sp. FL2044]|nr:hypothetical protein F4778DRAFT_720164 [Xylariomycetidae sp. FL2044]
MPSSINNNIIDLTDDGDGAEKEEEIVAHHNRLQLRSPSKPSPAKHPVAGLGADAVPFPKRRKLSPALPPKDALASCLNRQVFPHVDRAIDLIRGTGCDVEQIGRKVTSTVVDSDFERHYYEGNGRISSQAEALLAARVHNLVRQFSESPEFRLRRPPERAPANAVLPSIENATNGAVIEVDGEENGGHDYDDGEDYDSDSDEDQDEDQDEDEDADADADEEDEFDDDGYEYHVPTRPKTPPPRPRPKQNDLITPQRVRARIKAIQWQSGRVYESRREGTPQAAHNRWFSHSTRPYLKADDREQIHLGIRKHRGMRLPDDELVQPSLFHVDFSDEEVSYLRYVARIRADNRVTNTSRSDIHDLRHLLKKFHSMKAPQNPQAVDLKAEIIRLHGQGYAASNLVAPPPSISKRSAADVTNFLHDLLRNTLQPMPTSLYLERCDELARSENQRASRAPSYLFSREISGARPSRGYIDYKKAFKNNREDYLEPKIEWTNCAGDIMTVSWLSDTTFICGTTTHSDSHNQQYNKPGNLLMGSAKLNTLQAYPDHRIVRPLISHGDNALDSMRESQDPWLYTSVVSSGYEPFNGLAFTSSFDKTVKIWRPDGESMKTIGTWAHDGRVNFVVASKHESGMVATGADIPTEAVRVYHLNDSEDVSHSSFDSYSCTRVHDEDYVPSDKWAYFPAAIRWGLAAEVRHLLLIGYSPRDFQGEGFDIPEDKQKTGELCLWNTLDKTQVKVNSAKTQNVFEVVWHPFKACFAAATSASQTSEKIEHHIRTQIRIFELNKATGQYGAIKTLDCSAIDINELCIRPNCALYSYVTAACTDGRVYVWDSAGSSDLPMCILEHGEPVEELLGDRELEDVGVKFTAWATTTDRLYTGSSDGVVKVWNIRHGNGVLVKDLMEVGAPITAGSFSPDFTKLVIGDGSGRVYLLALDDEEESTNTTQPAAISAGFLRLQIGGKQQAIRRPRPFIPHAEIPPPADSDSTQPNLETGQTRAKDFLSKGELILHPDITIGAVQGEKYAQTNLFRAEAHVNGDINEPLVDEFQIKQQFNQRQKPNARQIQEQREIRMDESLHMLQSINISADMALGPEVRAELAEEGAEIEFSPLDFDYESSPEDLEDDDDDDAKERETSSKRIVSGENTLCVQC